MQENGNRLFDNETKQKKAIKRKVDEGITLVALVLTIIVLLILAGVTIYILTGKNNIIDQVIVAKKENQIQEEKEKIKIAISAQQKSQLTDYLTKEGLKQELAQDDVQVLRGEDNFIVHYVTTNHSYQIAKTGEIEGPVNLSYIDKTYAGDITRDENGNLLEGTAENPYQISCVEDFMDFSKQSKSNGLANKVVVMTKDINFASELSYADASSTDYGDINENGVIEDLITELTTTQGFKPIANFLGTFDGNHFQIKNLLINRTTNNTGLFSTITVQTTIKNLSIHGKITSSASYVASLAGVIMTSASEKTGEISNCYNYCTIEGKSYVAGLVGYVNNQNKSYKIVNCANYGKIQSEREYLYSRTCC